MKKTNITKQVIIVYKFKFSISAIISPKTGICLINFRSFCVTIFVINSAIDTHITTLISPIDLNKNYIVIITIY